jgi:beta propeller domain-containing protein
VGAVSLSSGATTPTANAGLFLHDSKLITVTGTGMSGGGVSPFAYVGQWMGGNTLVEVMDASHPEQPVTKWRAEIDGYLLATRRIGNRLYVVTRFVPRVAGLAYGAVTGPLADANRQVLANTPTTALLPAVRINGGTSTPLASPGHIYAPPQGARPPLADMVAVSAIDLVDLRIAQSVVVLASPGAVSVSANNLYLTSSRMALRTPAGVALPEPALYLTDVHQLRLGERTLDIVGTGVVEGFVDGNPDRALFRLSELNGKLRIVTSSSAMWGSASKNRLTILEPSNVAPGLLRTVSFLPNATRPEPIGKPGELLYGTRFVGERLYAVTFMMIDPLYIVDLLDVSDPRITAKLEMPGFSEYLHPLPNGMLLGFGKDAVPAVGFGDGQASWYQGLLLSLYDVSNAGVPREVQRIAMGKRGSDSILLRDHHAFSELLRGDGTGIIALPASINDGVPPANAAASTFYPWKESGLLRFELRGASATDMRLAPLPALITHSASTGLPGGVDAARFNARSVLFGAGAVYFANGQLWRQDANGQVSGPY